jgi:signal transduction histidine kinase
MSKEKQICNTNNSIGLTIVIYCSILFLLPAGLFSQDYESNRKKVSQQIDSLINLSAAETNTGKAVEWAEQAINMADSLRIQLLKAKALRQSGISWKRWGNTIKSTERLTEAIRLFELLNNKKLVNQSKIDLGETYRAATGFDHAIAVFNEVLPQVKAYNDSNLMAETYNRMAATNYELFYMHPDFQLIFNDSIRSKAALLKKLNELPSLKKILNTSEAYLDSAIWFTSPVNTELKISNENIRASLFNQLLEIDSAITIYNKTIAMAKTSKLNSELPLLLTNKARIIGKYRLNMPEEAIEIGLEALEIAKKTNINIYVFLAREVLHDNYLAIGNYELAYEQLSEASKLMEQFQFENLKLLLNSQEYELQIHKRELEIFQRQFQIRLLVFSVATVVIIFLVFAFVLIKKNRKQNILLCELNKKNNIISLQNQELVTSNAEKDKLFSIIAHDLKSPFQSFLGFSELLKEDVHSFEAAELEQLAATMNKSANRTMNLLNELLEWARFKQDRIEFSPEPVNLSQVTSEILYILEGSATAKNIRLIQQIPENLNLKADKHMLKTVLRNLVGNAIKFTHSTGQVEVIAQADHKQVKIVVKDNGIGLQHEQLARLFNLGETPVRKGTANESGTGLGLILCKEFIEKHNGTIWVESEVEKGSNFIFSIPIQI